MPLISNGYMPASSVVEEQEDWQLFLQNIDLLLQHKQTILSCSDYFFCTPSFSYCSWAWVSNDGPLGIGYLLLGWQNRLLVRQCPDIDCGGEVLITSFSGSILSGNNSWSGYCTNCWSRKTGSRTDIRFYELVDFISKLRHSFPAVVQERENYDGYQFSWGGTVLEPVIKKRIVLKPVAEPVTLAVLIEELKVNNIRKPRPVNIHLLKQDIKLKFSGNRLNSIQF